MNVTIYHNPKCSKSRQTLELIRERGIEPTITRYLDEPPDVATLGRLVDSLGVDPEAIVRKKEPAFAALGVGEEGMDRDGWLRALAANPILIERPIVVVGDRARIGRPPENVIEILP